MSDGAPGLWPGEIAGLYDIPLDRDLSGQCVGIVALGGGYLASDIASAAAQANRPVAASLVTQSVKGTRNRFGIIADADAELALDLQVLAGIIPTARLAVYFTRRTGFGLADAVNAAGNDGVNRPSVLSISWGIPEKNWMAPARAAMDAALQAAVDRGITIVAAAGDALATAGLLDGAAHVLYPASSPNVLACGGTRLTLAADGGIADEAVWNDGSVSGTGGGISDIYAVPDYQSGLALPASLNDGGRRRGLPDVAASAARSPGYRIVLGGATRIMPGTSASTPLWAAIVAILNAANGKTSGQIHPLLYDNPHFFRPIVSGTNKSADGIGYSAGPGWNACAGLGSPNGAALFPASGAMV